MWWSTSACRCASGSCLRAATSATWVSLGAARSVRRADEPGRRVAGPRRTTPAADREAVRRGAHPGLGVLGPVELPAVRPGADERLLDALLRLVAVADHGVDLPGDPLERRGVEVVELAFVHRPWSRLVASAWLLISRGYARRDPRLHAGARNSRQAALRARASARAGPGPAGRASRSVRGIVTSLIGHEASWATRCRRGRSPSGSRRSSCR